MRIVKSISRFFSRPAIMYWIAPALLFIALVLYFSGHASPSFLQRIQDIVERVVKEGAPLALVAMGAGLVLSTSGVDISTAGVATAGGVTFATCSQLGFPLPVSMAMALALGVLSGTLLGIGVHKNLPPLILSWAAGSIWIVGSMVFAEAEIVTSNISRVSLKAPPEAGFWEFGGGGFATSLTVLIVAIGFIYLTNLPLRARAVGANRDSAVYAGIRTKSVYIKTYALSGGLSAMAGGLWALLNAGAPTTDHVGKELIAIAIAILGGTVMAGGYLFLPSIVAAAFFWVILDTLVKGMNLEMFENHQQHMATGLFAVLFVLILLPLGKRLSGPTQRISAEQKTREK